MKLFIEDDDDQLKVPADEIPPVRVADADGLDGAAPVPQVLGGEARALDPQLGRRPTGIPGLALRVPSKGKAT